MYNEIKKFTKFTVEQSGHKIVYELPYEDVTGEDIMHAVKTLMIGMTFFEDTVYASMANYLEQNCELYDIYHKSTINNDE